MGMRRVLLFNLSAVLQLDALEPLPATMMLMSPKMHLPGRSFRTEYHMFVFRAGRYRGWCVFLGTT